MPETRDGIARTHDSAPVKGPTEARQGKPYHRVRYVLFIGLALIVVAFAATYFLTPPH
jgi:hypothetical protein